MKHVFRGAAAAAVTVALGAGAAGVAGLAGDGAVTAGAATGAVATLSVTRVWQQNVTPGSTKYVHKSSPTLVTFAGTKAAVVGDSTGDMFAASLTGGGAEIPGYPLWVGAPVTSTPSVVPGTSTVLVGSGNPASNCDVGGYNWLAWNGSSVALTTKSAPNPSYDTACSSNGVQASMAVGTLQGQTATVAGNLGQNEYAFNASSGATLPGFPWYQGDSMFSTAAVADVEGTGTDQIVEGGASSTGFGYTTQYRNGGHIRILSGTGNSGQREPNGGLVCQMTTTESITSSPAVGKFLGGTQVGIAVGTGATYPSAAERDKVIAMTTGCGAAWTASLAGTTTASPALADVLGNGQLQVVETTTTGGVYALNGSNGSVAWHTQLAAGILGSPVTADLGGGYQDVVVASLNGLYILTGRTGTALVSGLTATTGFQNSPLVTDNATGTVGITVAGYQNGKGTFIDHYMVAGSPGADVTEAGAWPEFHHDPQLTGDAGTPPPGPLEVECTPPATTPSGYYLAGGDGGIFNFGNLPFCGSTGNIRLNKPVVGVAATSNYGGYWEVASDGGIFTFGNAGFAGSMGGQHLNAPVVGMAPDFKSGGYWEVASDGGIFSFTAPFYGSMGGQHLNAPIVGMASTPTGAGYWLVASDGGIFAFGAAGFHGSMGGQHLNAPIVGMALDHTTGGYWEVASDGGIFSFTAPYHGSMGGQHLNAPIVGMASTPAGRGYWLGASDGGIFSFTVPYYGSMGGQHLNAPVVTMTGV